MSNAVAIVGCGTIGQGWAVTFARANIAVRMFDALVSPEVTLGRMRSLLAQLQSLGEIADAEDAADRITVCAFLEAALESVEYVQECLPETIDCKQSLFLRLDSLTDPATVLASSTSSLAPSTFVGELSGASRCLVAHPFNPPYLVPVVEVVPTPHTTRAVVERTITLMRTIGQLPVLLRAECSGLLLNRLQAALLNEAMSLVADGVIAPADLDQAVRWGLAPRWMLLGPLATADLNADGFADYARKFAGAYRDIGTTLHVDAPWEQHAIDAVEAACRQRMSAASLAQGRQWRDQMLIEIRSLLRSRQPGSSSR